MERGGGGKHNVFTPPSIPFLEQFFHVGGACPLVILRAPKRYSKLRTALSECVAHYTMPGM